MKITPEIRAKKASAAVNQVKMTKSHFTYNWKEKRDELVDLLRKCGCPYPVAVVSSLISHNLIKRDNGIYTFTTTTPIHYTTLINDLNKVSKKAVESVVNAPSTKSKKKELGEKTIGTSTSTPLVITAEIAIKYLKGEGYKVYKPITQFEEC